MGRQLGVSGLALALLFASACGAVSAAEAAGLRPARLRCEYLADPRGIDERQPRLSWVDEASDRGARGLRQTAYQVLAATSAQALRRDQGDLWDSGKVQSGRSSQIQYAGKALGSGQACWWKVRVWTSTDSAEPDGDGKPSAWSQPATWSMGLLDSADWKAKWISAPVRMKPTTLPTSEPAAIILRKAFQTDRPIRRAMVYVCGLGQYELFLNGLKVGDRILEPGWTNYRKTCLYSTYDLTSQLRQGRNALGLMLGNGMYNVVGGRYTKFTGSFGPPKAILQLEVEYYDGTVMRVVTDESWKASESPITFTCIYGGEDYDARKAQTMWDFAGFVEDNRWKPATVVDGPGGRLRSQMIPPIIVKSTLRPAAPPRLAAGAVVYDFGQNFSGGIRVTLRGPAGATVKFIPAERMNGDQADQSASGGPCTFSYTLRGQRGRGSETWAPQFTYTGFRYVRVEGAVPAGTAPAPGQAVIERLEGKVLYPDVETLGEFACSNDLLNKVHWIINWAIVSNMKSVFTDCPHREKLGWLEESHLMGPAIMDNYDVPALYRKIVDDMAEAQLDNGLVPDIAPEYTVFKNGFRDSPEWGSAAVIVPWLIYQRYGDERVLAKHYDMMKRYVDYLGRTGKDHIVSHGLGDWYDIGPKPPGQAQNTPTALTATAFYYHDVTIVQRAAALLGRSEDAARFEKLGKQIREAFNREFFKADTAQYATGSQTSNAMALAMGLVDENHRAAVVENLVREIRARGNHTTSGDVGHCYVLRALTENGRSDVVYDMVSRKDHPSYGYQVEHGATSLTEAWDGPTRGASQNHFMLGHVEEWFYQGLAGINVDLSRADAERICIRPNVVGDVTWARAKYESVLGRIISDWRRDGGNLTLNVTIPPNAVAVVYVPAADPQTLSESGFAIERARGVKVLRREKQQVVVAVESGTYRFESLVTPAAESAAASAAGSPYADKRPWAKLRMDAGDQGVVLSHGGGPEGCDDLGARDVWVYEWAGRYYMHYDGAGPKGWLACLATSNDLSQWSKQGPVLQLGPAGSPDSASASYGTTYFDGLNWHMFYLGTPNVTPAPDRVPGFPYLTLKARSKNASGPWIKQPNVVPFSPKEGSYYSSTASPGQVVRRLGEYMMFFSAATIPPVKRTIGIARTRDLDGPWKVDEKPILPQLEQIENTSLYYEEENQTWFLFTNHVGIRDGLEYTDAVWVYWTKNLNSWEPQNKAIVLDGGNCKWSKQIIGLPSVLRVGNRLALFYDGSAEAKIPPGVKSHMGRDIGLAWLDLPLTPPK